jgi:hypothetical protein
VQYFAGIENTHFGQVCYEADWLLKSISLGKERLPHANIESRFDLEVENRRRALIQGSATNLYVFSRGWFYPTVDRVNVFSDVVLLEKFQIGVFTEILGAEVDGHQVSDLSKVSDPALDAFSKSFNDNYDAATQDRPVLAALKGLARLASLAKGLRMSAEAGSFSFFLSGYAVTWIDTHKEAPVLTVLDNETKLAAFGGVQLSALAERLRSGDASALRDVALAARKDAGDNVLTWTFNMDVEDGHSPFYWHKRSSVSQEATTRRPFIGIRSFCSTTETL